MIKIQIYTLATVFKPTTAKINGRYDSIMRVDNWTTNACWLIRSDLETKLTKEIRESTRKPDIKTVLKNIKVKKLKKLELLEEVKITYDQAHAQLVNGNLKVLVNVYYLTMLDKTNFGNRFEFWGTTENEPVVIRFKDDKEIIGLIMPIRQ